MPNTKNYIAEFGNKTFDEVPFNDADAVAICEIFYMPFENVVSASADKNPLDFSQSCEKLFEQRGCKHKALGLLLTNVPSKRMMEMSAALRYKDMKIIRVKSVYSQEPAVQYCSASFLLPDGTVFIVYRGTDDTVAGWAEDLNIYTRKGSPSYDIALEDLNEIAEKHSGNIILCGHSKGGNIALYTACKCSDEIRERIAAVYNLDGPGYADMSLFATPEYKSLLPRYKHFVPSSSFIGMLMEHDDDYTAVKSNKHIGMLQHDVGTWQIKDGKLITVPDTDIVSKVVDEWLSTMFDNLSSEGEEAMDKIVNKVALGLGYKTLAEVSRHAKTAIDGAVDAYNSIDPDVRQAFTQAFKGGMKVLRKSAKFVYNTTYKTADTVMQVANNLT